MALCWTWEVLCLPGWLLLTIPPVSVLPPIAPAPPYSFHRWRRPRREVVFVDNCLHREFRPPAPARRTPRRITKRWIKGRSPGRRAAFLRPNGEAVCDAALSGSPPCDEAGPCPGLRPVWRKGAISRPFVSTQLEFRDHATFWPSFRSRLRICEIALECPCQSPS